MTHRFSTLALCVLLAGGLAARTAHAQRTVPFSTRTLGGQRVTVLPLTMVVASPEVDSGGAPLLHDRYRTLRWVDSLIGDAFTGRAPEVQWVLPPEVRKAARRSAGFVSDPDQMGQAIMRAPNLKRVPDPLRSQIRTLVALTGGRYVMIPAALAFSRDTAGTLHADLAFAFADARTGDVLWRSIAAGAGPEPGRAVQAALATVFPDVMPTDR